MSDQWKTLENVLNEIHVERLQQDVQFGQQNHSPDYWLGILREGQS